ncbi:cell division protein FtsQ, partial [Burkholderia multivorans]
MPLQPPRVGDESTADLTGIIRARRREVWAKRLTVLGSIAAVLALAAVAWFSPLLALGSVSVEGSELVAGGKVADFVEAEHGGTPLPQLRLSRIEAEVLEKFPRAEAADVRYSGPQSISIAVTDRTPVIAIAAGGG